MTKKNFRQCARAAASWAEGEWGWLDDWTTLPKDAILLQDIRNQCDDWERQPNESVEDLYWALASILMFEADQAPK